MKIHTFLKASVSAALCLCMALGVSAVSYAAAAEQTNFYAAQRAHTDPDNVFTVKDGGDRFILLDTLSDGYLCLAYSYYGRHVFDPDSTTKFDIEDENNLAYFLNNEFLKSGNSSDNKTYKLPQSIINNLVEHKWITEGGPVFTDYTSDYETVCRVAVPSRSEIVKYYHIFGYLDDLSQTSFITRSSYGRATQKGVMLSYITQHITKAGMIRTSTASKAYALRPIFVLDKDFFKKERINISLTGGNIIKLIKTRHTKNELSGVYTRGEINKLFEPLAPQARSVRVTGEPCEGQTLHVQYEYYAPDGQTENGTKILWVRYLKNESGAHGSVITGANEKSYTLTKNDVGFYISARVIPMCKNKAGRATEAEFYRNNMLKILPFETPKIENIRISGNVGAGAAVYADYKYTDKNSLEESGSEYTWQYSKDAIAFTDIEKTISRSFIIPKEYESGFLRFKVKFSFGEEYVSPALPIKNGEEEKAKSFSTENGKSVSVFLKENEDYTLNELLKRYAVSFTVSGQCLVKCEGAAVYTNNIAGKTEALVIKSDINAPVVITPKKGGETVIENISYADMN